VDPDAPLIGVKQEIYDVKLTENVAKVSYIAVNIY
jgi:hypothetical protein